MHKLDYLAIRLSRTPQQIDKIDYVPIIEPSPSRPTAESDPSDSLSPKCPHLRINDQRKLALINEMALLIYPNGITVFAYFLWCGYFSSPPHLILLHMTQYIAI